MLKYGVIGILLGIGFIYLGMQPDVTQDKLQKISGQMVEASAYEKKGTVRHYNIKVQGTNNQSVELEIDPDLVTREQIVNALQTSVEVAYKSEDVYMLKSNGQTIISFEQASQNNKENKKFMTYAGFGLVPGGLLLSLFSLWWRRK